MDTDVTHSEHLRQLWLQFESLVDDPHLEEALLKYESNILFADCADMQRIIDAVVAVKMAKRKPVKPISTGVSSVEMKMAGRGSHWPAIVQQPRPGLATAPPIQSS